MGSRDKPIDEQQLRRLYEQHGPALALYARQWCMHCDDALQEALIDLVQQIPEPRDPVAWLFKTVRCKAINQSRSEQRRSRHQHLAAQQREPWFIADAAQNIESGEVEMFLQELSPVDREILVARIWGEMSFEQIAELVEKSLSFVYRRFQQTLSLLEKKMNRQVRSQ